MYILPKTTVNPATGAQSSKSNDGLGRENGSIVMDESLFHLFTAGWFTCAYTSRLISIHFNQIRLLTSCINTMLWSTTGTTVLPIYLEII